MRIENIVVKIHNCDFINKYHTDETSTRLVLIAHGHTGIRFSKEGSISFYANLAHHIREIPGFNSFFSFRELYAARSMGISGGIDVTHLRLSFCAPQGSRISYQINADNPSLLPLSERIAARIMCSNAFMPNGLDVNSQHVHFDTRISNLILTAKNGKRGRLDFLSNEAFAHEVTHIEHSENSVVSGTMKIKTDVLYMTASTTFGLSLFDLLKYLKRNLIRPTQRTQYNHIIINVCNVDPLFHHGKSRIGNVSAERL